MKQFLVRFFSIFFLLIFSTPLAAGWFGWRSSQSADVACLACEYVISAEIAARAMPMVLNEKAKEVKNINQFFHVVLYVVAMMQQYSDALRKYAGSAVMVDDFKQLEDLNNYIKKLKKASSNFINKIGTEKDFTDTVFGHVTGVQNVFSALEGAIKSELPKIKHSCSDCFTAGQASEMVRKKIIQQFLATLIDELSFAATKMSTVFTVPVRGNILAEEPLGQITEGVVSTLQNFVLLMNRINILLNSPLIKLIIFRVLEPTKLTKDDKEKLEQEIKAASLNQLMKKYLEPEQYNKFAEAMTNILLVVKKVKEKIELWKKIKGQNFKIAFNQMSPKINQFLHLMSHKEIPVLVQSEKILPLPPSSEELKKAIEEAERRGKKIAIPTPPRTVPPSQEEMKGELKHKAEKRKFIEDSKKLPEIKSALEKEIVRQEKIGTKLRKAEGVWRDSIEDLEKALQNKKLGEEYKKSLESLESKAKENVEKLSKQSNVIQQNINSLTNKFADLNQQVETRRQEMVDEVRTVQSKLYAFTQYYRLPTMARVVRSTKKNLALKSKYQGFRKAVDRVLVVKNVENLSDEELADLWERATNLAFRRDDILASYKTLVSTNEQNRINDLEKESVKFLETLEKKFLEERTKALLGKQIFVEEKSTSQTGSVSAKELSQEAEPLKREFKERQHKQRMQFYEAKAKAIELILKNNLPRSIRVAGDLEQKLQGKIKIENNQIALPLNEIQAKFDPKNPEKSMTQINEALVYVSDIAKLWDDKDFSSNFPVMWLSNNEITQLETTLQSAKEQLGQRYVPITQKFWQPFSEFCKELHGLAEALYLYAKNMDNPLMFQITGNKKYNDEMKNIFTVVTETRFSLTDAEQSIERIKNVNKTLDRLQRNFSASTVDPSQVTPFTDTQKEELKKVSLMMEENYRIVQSLLPKTLSKKVEVEKILIPKKVQVVGEKSIPELEAEFDHIKDEIMSDLKEGKIKKNFKRLPDSNINEDTNRVIDKYNTTIEDFIAGNPPYWFEKEAGEESVQTLQKLRSELEKLKSEIYKKIEEIKKPRIFTIKESPIRQEMILPPPPSEELIEERRKPAELAQKSEKSKELLKLSQQWEEKKKEHDKLMKQVVKSPSEKLVTAVNKIRDELQKMSVALENARATTIDDIKQLQTKIQEFFDNNAVPSDIIKSIKKAVFIEKLNQLSDKKLVDVFDKAIRSINLLSQQKESYKKMISFKEVPQIFKVKEKAGAETGAKRIKLPKDIVESEKSEIDESEEEAEIQEKAEEKKRKEEASRQALKKQRQETEKTWKEVEEILEQQESQAIPQPPRIAPPTQEEIIALGKRKQKLKEFTEKTEELSETKKELEAMVLKQQQVEIKLTEARTAIQNLKNRISTYEQLIKVVKKGQVQGYKDLLQLAKEKKEDATENIYKFIQEKSEIQARIDELTEKFATINEQVTERRAEVVNEIKELQSKLTDFIYVHELPETIVPTKKTRSTKEWLQLQQEYNKIRLALKKIITEEKLEDRDDKDLADLLERAHQAVEESDKLLTLYNKLLPTKEEREAQQPLERRILTSEYEEFKPLPEEEEFLSEEIKTGEELTAQKKLETEQKIKTKYPESEVIFFEPISEED